MPNRTTPTPREWLFFALQCALVVGVQVVDDGLRGRLWPPDPTTAVENAHRVVAFEREHHLFVEPAVQQFFQHSHNFLGFSLAWPTVMAATNGGYMILHVFATLFIGMWVFSRHRERFPFLRDVMLVTTVCAFVIYELYPMAPPRLTGELIWQGHPYHFQDTMRPLIGTGTLPGIPIVYNPLSAMPSLHIAWAICVGMAVLLLARRWPGKLLGALYPLVVFAIAVITANHYVSDALAAACVVAVAAVLVAPIEWRRRRRPPRDRMAPA